ncbi:(Na+)-NQR maturation NqrM [Oceanospirillum sediminis]|uniref:(Na+)-NQR maturation NqrM n=1 Tax=Oceanospirillum sediminis TaxID=2760088 RepID=A0A839IQI0_9GAMM|nr:(Na+)-NQR maturation NqrM [Oceanospirillum sediminis]MBB1487505.1 (Na+)-NQR maturation NqrM [Oceanospirillum sediminis]
MTTMILALIVVALLMTGMAVGVLFGRKPIAGSCGGMSAIGMVGDCDICGGNKDVCETEQEKKAAQNKSEMNMDLAYDATQNDREKK